MRSSRFALFDCLALIALATALADAPARAGSFVFEGQCQEISTDPPRYRLRFLMVDTHAIKFYCRVRFEPISVDGSLLRPILGCAAPGPLLCTIDPTTGAADFTATPCLNPSWSFTDSLWVIVDGVPAYFQARLYTTGDQFLDAEQVSFPCANPVGVESTPAAAPWLAPLAPNPARSITTLRFGLTRDGPVQIAAFDVTGRLCHRLVEGVRTAGSYAIVWDLRDQAGQALPTGIYLVRMEAEGRTLTRSVIQSR